MSYDKKIGLVLQGGGALGSYQAGVYEALAAAEYTPDWVAGVSIGAINAAIIAGNATGKPGRTATKLLGGNHGAERMVAERHWRAAWGLAEKNECTFSPGVWPTGILRAA